MFTGLIQDIGTISSVQRLGDDVRLRISCGLDLAREKLGASIACSGVCLTVVDKGGKWFDVEVSSETLSKTTIGSWNEGDHINLESSLRMGDELGGHFVFGHVDALAVLSAIAPDGESKRLTITPPSELMPYIAPKGSISLDGISLTVNEVGDDSFGVCIIPHTWERTTLSRRVAGDKINIEIDMLARYVARQMGKAT